MLIMIMTVLAAVLPSILLLRWFRNSDKFPEPWPVVRRVFWRGVWIIPLVLFVTQFVEAFQPTSDVLQIALYQAFVLAAIPEEFFKYIVLIFFCLRLKEFDEPMDGMVYGATVSLGFATLENVMYVMDGGMAVAIMRALTAVPAHALTGAIMGYFVGLILVNPAKRKQLLLLAFIIPTLLHGFYDLPAMYVSAPDIGGLGKPYTGIMLAIFMVVVMLEWRLTVIFKRRMQLQQNL